MSSIPGRKEDPLRGLRYRIFIGGKERAGYSEVSGLSMETDVKEYREGNDGQVVRKLPGTSKSSEITLKRGITTDTHLYEWYLKMNHPKVGAKPDDQYKENVDIVLLSQDGKTKIRSWRIYDAWPSKYEESELKASDADVIAETLTLQNHGFVMTFPKDFSV